MDRKITQKRNRGFSLVELIIVIAIMAVLVAVLAPQLLRYVERSRIAKDEQNLAAFERVVTYALADASDDGGLAIWRQSGYWVNAIYFSRGAARVASGINPSASPAPPPLPANANEELANALASAFGQPLSSGGDFPIPPLTSRFYRGLNEVNFDMFFREDGTVKIVRVMRMRDESGNLVNVTPPV